MYLHAEKLEKLENFGDRCYCDKPEFEEFIWKGRFSEIHELCTICGGYRD